MFTPYADKYKVAKWRWRQPISREIFTRKYMLHGEKQVEEVFAAVANEIAAAETPELRSIVADTFYRVMALGKFLPAGRILANARPGAKMKNYNNCFTIAVEDSLAAIFDSLKEDALISKAGGGVGFDVSALRPKGEALSGGGESSGIVSFLRIFDQSAKTIMTGGQRRSAHIALLSISHPDIEEFITIKRGNQNNELTQFNVSVKISDRFMEAARNDRDWPLTFGGRVYKTVKAKKLLDTLVRHAYIHNEPGVFYEDTVEKYNNGWWAFKMDRVNPCGELVMPAYSVCCLAAVNLSRFVSRPFSRQAAFDFDDFRQVTSIGIRFLDNVLDRADYPLKKIGDFSRQWRRIGLGITGLGSALAGLGLPYGEKESLRFCGTLAAVFRDASYLASCDLAAEKGSFPAFRANEFLRASFVKTLPAAIQRQIAEKGMRNIQINTIAPTGTTSLSVGQNCSSGIEPIFSLQYARRLRSGRGDQIRQESVLDCAWLDFIDKTAWPAGDQAPAYFATSDQIAPRAALKMQAVWQKYIDHSISKTLNLPPEVDLKSYKKLFFWAHQKGLKGFTSFNPRGSMRGVLEYRENQPLSRRLAPKRPNVLPASVHNLKSFAVIVGHYKASLYEVFVIDNLSACAVLADCSKGQVVKTRKNHYDFQTVDGRIVLPDFTQTYASVNASLARFISMALRHGTPLQFIVDQLSKDTGFFDSERVLARVLKKYIKDGEQALSDSNTCGECQGLLVYRDGCLTCRECGWSKCF